MGGVLCLLFGSYYIGSACDDFEGRCPLRFYQSTILGRIMLCLSFVVLVLRGNIGRGILILAGINALSAWTLTRALVKRQKEEENCKGKAMHALTYNPQTYTNTNED